MIKIKNLIKKFNKVTAIENLSLDIKAGEIFGFLGPNGAGKTTTIKIMCGILKPTEGQVIIGTHDIQKEPMEAKRLIGLVPDEPFIYKKLTGREFLNFIGDLYSVPRNVRDQKIEEYIAMFELQEWQDVIIENYSHGMQQRVLIAAVLLHNPKVIFLDEPMVGLDPKGGGLVKKIFSELSRRGVTIFMSTHTLEIAEKLCQRIGIIDWGKLIALGTKDELREESKRKKQKLGDDSLENIFLNLTGGAQYEELLKHL